ncbi:hypothetical protein B0J14DRAFT_473400 [Halenospora varia]|nr:hypothetical protein B0J14DRAFT_473400 [Halenospora varia]
MVTATSLKQAWKTEEDWTGIASKEERKKIQNRLNQRAHRKKNGQKETKSKKGGFHIERFLVENESHMAVMQAMFVATNLASTNTSSQNQLTASHAWSPNGTHSSFTYFPLTPDHLLHLIHHNVFHALTTNKSILSQFTTAKKVDSSVLRLSTKTICDGVSVVLGNEGQPIPPALYPTQAQKTISHPSYVNMFPFPWFRDNLIRYQDSFNPYELCNDLFGEIVRENGNVAFGSVRMDAAFDIDESADDSDGFTFRRRGMIVWGESWDPEGWEVTPGFLRKWSWLLDGCESLVASSNRWRAGRGRMRLIRRLWNLYRDLV